MTEAERAAMMKGIELHAEPECAVATTAPQHQAPAADSESDSCGQSAASSYNSPTSSPNSALAREADASHNHALGTMVADLGYKRVYISSVEKLRGLTVWEKNRAFKPHRAAAIGKDKISSGWRKQVLPGVITCFEFVEPQLAIDAEIVTPEPVEGRSNETRLGILDGQHRRGALMFMADRHAWPENLCNVLVEVFPIATETAAKELFTEINKMEPVKLVDLPGVGEADVKLALSYAADALERKFPDMFKLSARCRPPHVHADTLRDELFQCDILSRFELRTGDDLLAYLLSVNEKMSKRSNDEWRAVFRGKQSELDRSLAKARQHGFFLGVDKAWMHR